MASKETILTAEGLRKLKEELAQRKGEIREEIVERLKEARAQGDLSENSEYDQAKEDQGKNEGLILELEQMIKTVTIIISSLILCNYTTNGFSSYFPYNEKVAF